MTVYLSGPISLGATCSPDEEAAFIGLFAVWAGALRAQGYDVISPPECEPQDSWEDYMRLGIASVCRADVVATLPRWLESRGAVLEVYIARQLGITVCSVSNLRSHEPPRNSGEGDAVNGPTPLVGGDESHTSPA